MVTGKAERPIISQRGWDFATKATSLVDNLAQIQIVGAITASGNPEIRWNWYEKKHPFGPKFGCAVFDGMWWNRQ
jgi:hypothetical protein